MPVFVYKNLTEEEVIDLLLKALVKNYNSVLEFYSILFRPSVKNSEDYSGIYFSKMILRKEFGLKREGKPGDFDILLIPYKDKHIFFDRTAVYEVKVLRPSIKNPKRNANSLGTTQINGLIEDGFPLIGLIHICLTEPIPENDCLEIKHYNRPIDVGNSQNNKDFDLEDYKMIKHDLFPYTAVENQKRRLISFNLPTFVDVYSTSMSFKEDGSYMMCLDRTIDLSERGNFNPKTKIETIEKIKEHFDNYSDSKYTKIEFTDV